MSIIGLEEIFLDVEDLDKPRAREIYFEIYVTDPKFDQVASGSLLELLVDYGVHSAPRRAIKRLQRALSINDDGIIGPFTIARANAADQRAVYADVLAQRCAHLAGILKEDETQLVFARGWFNRMGYFIRKTAEL